MKRFDYSIEEIYDCSFEEFCRRAYISPETFIRLIEAEIEILTDARIRLGEKFKRVDLFSKEWDYYNGLLCEINKRIESKQAKRRKYLLAFRRLNNADQS